jgi:hypothetical protein
VLAETSLRKEVPLSFFLFPSGGEEKGEGERDARCRALTGNPSG